MKLSSGSGSDGKVAGVTFILYILSWSRVSFFLENGVFVWVKTRKLWKFRMFCVAKKGARLSLELGFREYCKFLNNYSCLTVEWLWQGNLVRVKSRTLADGLLFCWLKMADHVFVYCLLLFCLGRDFRLWNFRKRSQERVSSPWFGFEGKGDKDISVLTQKENVSLVSAAFGR